jgi:predicted GTPase
MGACYKYKTQLSSETPNLQPSSSSSQYSLNMKVAILGATGQNGSSIINGLLSSTETKFVGLHCVYRLGFCQPF